ncbi:hypothetical protein SODALDRAFT_363766 [Sodiomyces alkalinus F11]|uniref:Uncharacterized protein n=1 Tax=Sodiomyces alkalinus (strain CBS 110278 / VKM F-3762 / F11) TaxID=1314773 RepID=A0A3N2PKY4_SODAK|nr:hypothetical protein SODALDRAFT_363766 [Sodiomyces alkalinus F11]ROT35074.1 hypothetical protein SODALDRAFT_363766 [Sodiomyces alkalinus F11]
MTSSRSTINVSGEGTKKPRIRIWTAAFRTNNKTPSRRQQNKLPRQPHDDSPERRLQSFPQPDQGCSGDICHLSGESDTPVVQSQFRCDHNQGPSSSAATSKLPRIRSWDGPSGPVLAGCLSNWKNMRQDAQTKNDPSLPFALFGNRDKPATSMPLNIDIHNGMQDVVITSGLPPTNYEVQSTDAPQISQERIQPSTRCRCSGDPYHWIIRNATCEAATQPLPCALCSKWDMNQLRLG